MRTGRTRGHTAGAVGVFMLLAGAGVAGGERFVDAGSPAPAFPYETWETAATNIQDAVAAAGNGETVWVAPGVYRHGGGPAPNGDLFCRVVLTNAVSVRAAGGREDTVIEGAADGAGNGPLAVRCAYLASGGELTGFTLTKGHTQTGAGEYGDVRGGGVFLDGGGSVSDCLVVTNACAADGGGIMFDQGGEASACVIRGNLAGGSGGGVAFAGEGSLTRALLEGNYAGAYGGGAYCVSGGYLANCLIVGNESRYDGGGVEFSVGGLLDNCTVCGNVAGRYGGGVDWSGERVRNSIVMFNDAPNGPNYYAAGSLTLEYSCTSPTNSPAIGEGCLDADPLFENRPASDYRLAAGSPCVNAGTNGYVNGALDLAGQPRIVAGTVDMGAYEWELIHYVDDDSTNPIPPYTSWATAATNIEDAVDVAQRWETVLVADGVYRPGVPDAWQTALHAHVCITEDITVRSLNGPPYTVIEGAPSPVTGGNGANALRCVYISEGRLSGFTLADGHTLTDINAISCSGGGVLVRGGEVSECVAAGCSADHAGGGIACYVAGRVSDCTAVSNTASRGGGLALLQGGSMERCMASDNDAEYGGGAYLEWQGAYTACTFEDNTASEDGGGLYTESGGVADRCQVRRNRAEQNGGGVCNGDGSLVRNTAVVGNRAGQFGGGAMLDGDGALVNCTVIDNDADQFGGGVYNGSLWGCGFVTNSVIYYNRALASDNWRDSSWVPAGQATYAYCCTVPEPFGAGNATNAPLLAGVAEPHLLAASPCRDAGWTAAASGIADLEGDPRILDSGVDIGCDEINPSSMAGPLRVAIQAESTNVVAGYELELISGVQGRASRLWWAFGDGHSAWDETVVRHAWSSAGDFEVTLWAGNDDGSAGTSIWIHVVSGETNYVWEGGGNHPPYTNWADAAYTIQDAIDACPYGGTVLVAADVYAEGGYVAPGATVVSRVGLYKPVRVTSASGSDWTEIRGGEDARCAYLTPGAELSGFTLTGGRTLATNTTVDAAGGGAYLSRGGRVADCVIAGNEARGDGSGGGVYCLAGGDVERCAIADNLATVRGGGVYCSLGGVIRDSTIQNNRAGGGGGGVEIASGGLVENCDLLANRVTGGYAFGGGAQCARGGRVEGCRIRGNEATTGGGGISVGREGAVRRCAISGNTSTLSGGEMGGGGLRFEGGAGQAENCVITDNWAPDGGGVFFHHYGIMAHCTVVGNTATNGGGIGCSLASLATNFNNIVYFNMATNGANWWTNLGDNAVYASCCTTPDPGGIGNVTNQPLMRNVALRDLRLVYGSAGIDSAGAGGPAVSEDYEGRLRPLDGNFDWMPVSDMGAYEYDAMLSDADEDSLSDWEEVWAYGSNPTNANSDGDPMTDGAEAVAGTGLTDPYSFFRITQISGGPAVDVYFESAPDRLYTLERTDALVGEPWTNVWDQTDIYGYGGPMSLRDSGPLPADRSYRVRVQRPW